MSKINENESIQTKTKNVNEIISMCNQNIKKNEKNNIRQSSNPNKSGLQKNTFINEQKQNLLLSKNTCGQHSNNPFCNNNFQNTNTSKTTIIKKMYYNMNVSEKPDIINNDTKDINSKFAKTLSSFKTTKKNTISQNLPSTKYSTETVKKPKILKNAKSLKTVKSKRVSLSNQKTKSTDQFIISTEANQPQLSDSHTPIFSTNYYNTNNNSINNNTNCNNQNNGGNISNNSENKI